jgi:hypothetical protein
MTLAQIAEELDRRSFRDCRRCDATGIASTETVTCGRCHGSGKTKAGKGCKGCEGLGKHEIVHNCPRCLGTTQERVYGLARAVTEIRYVAEFGNSEGPGLVFEIPIVESEL